MQEKIGERKKNREEIVKGLESSFSPSTTPAPAAEKSETTYRILQVPDSVDFQLQCFCPDKHVQEALSLSISGEVNTLRKYFRRKIGVIDIQSGKHLMEIFTLPFIKYLSEHIFHKIFNFCSLVSSYFLSSFFSFFLILLITLQEVEGCFFSYLSYLIWFISSMSSGFYHLYVPGQNSFPKVYLPKILS